MILDDSPWVTDDRSRSAGVYDEDDVHCLIEERKPRSVGAAAFDYDGAMRLREAAHAERRKRYRDEK
jgi:hypothetical protein